VDVCIQSQDEKAESTLRDLNETNRMLKR